MNPVLFLQPAAVQMKGAPDSVPVENLHQTPVLDPPVIIAHRQRLVRSSGKTGVNISHSEIYIDDEDDEAPPWTSRGYWLSEGCEYSGATKNGNYWKICGDYGPRGIMGGDNNTTYHVVRWTGNSTSGMLAKSGDADAFEAPMAAAKPVAASIRGLDRSVISVELKSAGDAKVSVMNVNGAVVAKVSAENLQAGIHNLKWNSGIVPNGLYVVTVEHNGMINSKRVLLK